MNNITIKFQHDQDAGNPYKEFDNLGTIISWHRRYNIGEDHNFDSPREFFESLVEDKFSHEQLYNMSNERLKREVDRVAVIFPLFMYEHGNIALSLSSFSDPWDSGQLGYIYVTKEKAREEYSVKNITRNITEKIKRVFSGEIKEYEHYINGETYGYIVEDTDGNELDSRWGFYGSDLQENGMLDYLSEYKDYIKIRWIGMNESIKIEQVA